MKNKKDGTIEGTDSQSRQHANNPGSRNCRAAHNNRLYLGIYHTITATNPLVGGGNIESIPANANQVGKTPKETAMDFPNPAARCTIISIDSGDKMCYM